MSGISSLQTPPLTPPTNSTELDTRPPSPKLIIRASNCENMTEFFFLRYTGLNNSDQKRLQEDEDRLLAVILQNLIAFMVMMNVSKDRLRQKVSAWEKFVEVLI